MATRSVIGKYNNTTGGVKSVYCHYDGYPEYVGKILVNHYNTPEKVTKLISMGDISSLEKSIGKKHDFNMPYNEKEKLGYTTFYHRDRGDELRINSNKSIKEYLLDANERWADYVYIYWGTKGDDTPTASKGWEYIQPYGLNIKDTPITSLQWKSLEGYKKKGEDKERMLKILSKYDQSLIGKLQTQIEEFFE